MSTLTLVDSWLTHSLYAHVARLRDRRHARGLRYAWVTILGYIVLAKLAGEDRRLGISQWVRYRQGDLAEVLHLQKRRAPCVNTYRSPRTGHEH